MDFSNTFFNNNGLSSNQLHSIALKNQHSESSLTIFSTASSHSNNSLNSNLIGSGNGGRRELTIGYLPLPLSAGLSWTDFDQQLGLLLEEYLHRIDPDMTLGIDSFSSIIGYQIVGCFGGNEVETGGVGTFIRAKKLIGNDANEMEETTPTISPMEMLLPTSAIRLRLSGGFFLKY